MLLSFQPLLFDQFKQTKKLERKNEYIYFFFVRKIDGLEVRDFTSSWRDGLAFNALIHAIRPELVDLRRIERMNPRERLEIAFKIAEEQLGVPALIDAEGLFDLLSYTIDKI